MMRKNHKSSLAKRLIAMLIATATLATTITVVLPLPTANAAAATSIITSATFKATDAKRWVAVAFTEPVCGNPDCTVGLTLSNFVFESGANDPGTGFESISAVTVSNAGTNWALLTMNATSVAGDTADKIRVQDVYTASGMVMGNSATNATASVALTTDAVAPTITATRLKDTTNKILLGFSEPVVNSTGAAVADTNFTYSDTSVGNVNAISTPTYTADGKWLILTTNVGLTQGTDPNDTINANSAQVFDLVGNAMATGTIAVSAFTADSVAPTISVGPFGRKGASVNSGNDVIYLGFSEPVFTTNGGTGSAGSGVVASTDFTYGGSETVSSLGLGGTAGEIRATLTMSAALTAFSTVNVGLNALYDTFGNGIAAATPTVTDNTFPVIRGVWVNQYIDHCEFGINSSVAGPASNAGGISALGGGTVAVAAVTAEATVAIPTEGSRACSWTDGTVVDGTDGFIKNLGVDIYDKTNSLYEFTQVKLDVYYEDAGASGLATSQLLFEVNDAADFTTASEWNIGAITEKTWTTITIDLTSAVSSGTALASQGSNPQYWGVKTAATSTFDDNDFLYVDNIRFSRGASSKSNQIIVQYSEDVKLATGDATAGNPTSIASTSSLGDLTTSKTLARIGAFASGTLTTKAGTNSVLKSGLGNTYTFTLADRTGGLINIASPVTLTGLFTPTIDITDASDNAIVAASTHTLETVIDALDLTSSTSAVTNFATYGPGSGLEKPSWLIAASQSGFDHYAVLYGTSASVNATSSVWDDSNDSTLATVTTTTTTLTGLTNNQQYYFNLAAVDLKGNVTLATEVSDMPKGSAPQDSTPPGPPTGVSATANDKNQVVIKWIDPTDADLADVRIYRSKGKGNTNYEKIWAVNKGTITYTDMDTKVGDVINYVLRAADQKGNLSTETTVVTLTNAAAVITPPATTTTTTTGETLTVNISAQNNSGESGTATITDVAGKAKVVLALTGGPKDTPQPAHVHMGSCAKLGDTKYTLTSVVNGASETTLDVDLAALKAGAPLAINVHKSVTEITTYSGCGDLVAAAAAETPTTTETEATETEVEDADLDTSTIPSAEIKLTDIASHWAKKEVQAMVEKGIIKGYKDGSFKPNDKLNRAEGAKLLCRVLGIEDSIKASKKPFNDVDTKMWYAGCVGELVSAKIVSGNADGTFRPMNNINRVEFLKLVILAYEQVVDEDEKAAVEALVKGKVTTAFTDLDSKAWYAGIVTAAKEKGFLQGKTCGKGKCVDAAANITRAEAATILYRVFNDLL